MDVTIIAAAQSISVRGEIARNIQAHSRLIEAASREGVQLIAFPELSLTGYEPDLAGDLAFSPEDDRLNPLRDLAERLGIIVIAGAPVRLETGLHIGSFVLFPDRSVSLYTKFHLGSGEETTFAPCRRDLLIPLGGESVSPAICAEISHPEHVARAAASGATVYLASVLESDTGYARSARRMQEYAGRHSMLAMMANHGADSGGYRTPGRSAVWSDRGQLIAALDGPGEGMVIASRDGGRWSGSAGSVA